MARRATAPLRAIGITRPRVAAARMMLERNATAVASRQGRSGARILCYHSVGTPEWGVNDVSLRRFRRHLELAMDAGYRFVPAETIASGAGAAGDLAITFDDGLRSVATNAAPVLKEYGIPWTLFVVTGWADGNGPWTPLVLDWNEIETLAKDGATIESHSVTHPDFGSLEPSMAAEELGASKLELKRRIGVDSEAFAIPFGQSKNWSAAMTAAASSSDYKYIFAQSVNQRPAGTIPRTFVTRFDRDAVFRAALRGAFDSWEEWY